MSPSRELHFPQFASLQRAAQIIELLREHLGLLLAVLPRANDHFHSFLRNSELGVQEAKSVRGIVLGAVLDAIRNYYPSETVLEEIEYQARRLAKLQVEPSLVHSALSSFDHALIEEVGRQFPDQLFVARSVVNHYHLFVTNVINVSLYQLWRADSKLLEDMSAVELAELAEKDLRARIVFLVRCWSGADAVAIHAPARATEAGARWMRPTPSGAELNPWPRELSTASILRLDPTCSRSDAGGESLDDGRIDSRVLSPGWRGRYRSVWSFPITTGSRQLGVLQLGFFKSFDWLPSEQAVLLQVAERLGLALTRCELVAGLSSREAQVRQLATHLQIVEERERKRISRELHDEAGQSLLCLRLQLEMIENSLSRRQKEVKSQIRSAREQSESVIVEIRRLISALSPNVLEQFGLLAAIRHLLKEFLKVSQAEAELDIRLPEDFSISNAASMVIYRFVQECFHNILSHSQAKSVKISAEIADGLLKWQVQDDGVGFLLQEVQKRENSYGLRGISERILLMGGTIDIQSAPGKGTSVTAYLPWREEPQVPGLTALARATHADRLPGEETTTPVDEQPHPDEEPRVGEPHPPAPSAL